MSEQNDSKLPEHCKVGVTAVLRLCYVLLLTVTVSLHAQQPERVMPGMINLRAPDSLLPMPVLDEAVGLAFVMSGRYAYIPMATRDSIVTARKGEKWTAAQTAVEVGATSMAFVTVARFVNLIRVEIVLMSGPDYKQRQTGVGYASMRHARVGSDAPNVQPALLLAAQRAVMKLAKDPSLYSGVQKDLRAVPATMYGVSGIAFQQDSTIWPLWQLFDENTVVSYDMVQTIVHRLHDVDSLTVIDIETRDSMYAMGRLYLVENDRAITGNEIRIFLGFDVSHVITGTFARVKEGARLTLFASNVDPSGSLTVARSATRIVKKDTKDSMREAVTACVDELFPRPKANKR